MFRLWPQSIDDKCGLRQTNKNHFFTVKETSTEYRDGLQMSGKYFQTMHLLISKIDEKLKQLNGKAAVQVKNSLSA